MWPFRRSEEDRYLDQCEQEVIAAFKRSQKLEKDVITFIKDNFNVRARVTLIGGKFYPHDWVCENPRDGAAVFEKLVSLADGNIDLATAVVTRCREIVNAVLGVREQQELVSKARHKFFSDGSWLYYD